MVTSTLHIFSSSVAKVRLGDWHATKGRWQQAAERFSSLVKVNQLDDPDATSVDQLRLAAALLEAGNRNSYEQWRQGMAVRLSSAVAPQPASIIKACLLLPADSNILECLTSAPQIGPTGNAGTALILPAGLRGAAWSDAKVLLAYRRGEFDDAKGERFLADNPPRLASFVLIQAMANWRLKDYWGAMVAWTRSYALIQAGARQGLVPLTVRAEIFPGLSDPGYLQAPWYDWAVVDLLLREWDTTIAEAEQSVGRAHGRAPSLEDLATARAAGECHALRGEWSEALRFSQFCLESNQQDSLDHATMDYVNAAIACLKVGDENAYLRVREEMAMRFKDSGENAPWRALEVGLVRPIDDRVAATFQYFADGLAHWSRDQTNDYWGLMLLSLHSYRRGDYAGALDLARESLSRYARLRDGTCLPSAKLSIIMALSQIQLENRSAAAAELARAESVVQTGFDLDYDQWHWRHWIGVRLLLEEARGLISQNE